MFGDNKITGKLGENFAVYYLKNKKYNILETNYKNKCGEIDIIAKDGEVYVFVEVKLRNSLDYGFPYEAVTKNKQNHIKNTALSYLKLNHLLDEVQIRFDCISILGERYEDCVIEHLENIF